MSEKITTVVLGLFAGVVFAGAILLGPKLLDGAKFKPAPPGPKLAPSPTVSVLKPVISPNLTLSLDLEDNLIATASPIVVSGKAPPGSTIVLFGPADEVIASASSEGIFSAKMKLEDGENEIAAAILNDPNQNVKRSVIFEISQ